MIHLHFAMQYDEIYELAGVDVPLNDLKEEEGAKLDIADAVVFGGVPRLALTISRFSSSLLSPSERVLWTLLVVLTFMT